MESRVKSVAREDAAGRVLPAARKAVSAAEKTQPVPCISLFSRGRPKR